MILGRFAGRALRSQAVNSALHQASGYILREMETADLKVKLGILKKKRSHHIQLLGRTVYRLMENGLDPISDEHTRTITLVLGEIDLEILAVRDEMKRRRAYQQARRDTSMR